MTRATDALRHAAFVALGVHIFGPWLAAQGVAGAETTAATPRRAVSTSAVSIDGLLEPLRARHRVPALGGCVVRGRDVVALGAVGLRARGDDTPITVDDLWHLGSCTKAMTATLCATFVADGRLRWDMTLAEVFPERVESMHAGWRSVTVAQLLQHRSGLPANPHRDGIWRELGSFDGTPRDARVRVLDNMLAVAPESPAGTTFLYSNAGYMIAGAVLERVADASWESLIRARLFEPLGMTSAGFGPPGQAEVVDQPRGHGLQGRGIAPGPRADNPPALGPAGTVHASLRDWAKFVALHLGVSDAATTPAAAVVDAARLAELHAPVARDDGDGYALGFAVTRRAWADGPILTHTGSNLMWFAAVWAAPDADFAVLAVCNQGGDEAAAAVDAACAAMIERFGPKRAR